MRIKRLDLLRGIAILLVLGRHLDEIPANLEKPMSYFFVFWKLIGWTGVDLFFVLSGFIISNLLFKKIDLNNFNLREFYLRRWLKIYPLFFVTLVMPVLFSRNHDFKNVLSEIFLMQSYFPGLWQHTWSLSVEEHFYIFLPILLWLSLKKNIFNKFHYILFFLILVIITARCFTSETGCLYTQTHLRVDAILFGVLIAYYTKYKPSAIIYVNIHSHIFLICAFLFQFFAIYFFVFNLKLFKYFGFTLLYFSFGIQMILLLNVKINFNFTLVPLTNLIVKIGMSSYSIYLIHIPLKIYIIDNSKFLQNNDNYYFTLASYITLSIFTGILINKFIQKPIISFRDYYYK